MAEEKLASGLAIIKNKNILLCWENSTAGDRTEIICIQDSRDVFRFSLCSPSSTSAAFENFLMYPSFDLLFVKQGQTYFF